MTEVRETNKGIEFPEADNVIYVPNTVRSSRKFYYAGGGYARRKDAYWWAFIFHRIIRSDFRVVRSYRHSWGVELRYHFRKED